MTRITDMGRLLAMALVAIVMLGVLTPLCTMPTCDDISVDACSDFQPACGDCPEAVVMKHTPDDAVASVAPTFGELVSLGQLAASAEPVPVTTRALIAPEATASPPPLDPLGVRLTV